MHALKFPRLNSRGPIEARSSCSDPVITVVSFPRLNSRGPIEAAGFSAAGGKRAAISTAQQPWPH